MLINSTANWCVAYIGRMQIFSIFLATYTECLLCSLAVCTSVAARKISYRHAKSNSHKIYTEYMERDKRTRKENPSSTDSHWPIKCNHDLHNSRGTWHWKLDCMDHLYLLCYVHVFKLSLMCMSSLFHCYIICILNRRKTMYAPNIYLFILLRVEIDVSYMRD